MAIQKWTAGTLAATPTLAFAAADLNNLASGSSILSSLGPFSNTTAQDVLCDISFALVAGAALGGSASISVFLVPLNLADGSTYGDGNFVAGTAKALILPFTYYKGPISSTSTGTSFVGTWTGIILPANSSFNFGINSQLGQTIAGSGNSAKFQTYNFQVS